MGESPKWAARLHEAAEARRRFFSGLIQGLGGLVMSTLAVLWAPYLAADSGNGKTAVLAAASTLPLGFWRLFSHRLDNAIVELYPDILAAEQALGVKPDRGLQRYLKPKTREATPKDLEKLSEDRRMGWRWSFAIRRPWMVRVCTR